MRYTNCFTFNHRNPLVLAILVRQRLGPAAHLFDSDPLDRIMSEFFFPAAPLPFCPLIY